MRTFSISIGGHKVFRATKH